MNRCILFTLLLIPLAVFAREPNGSLGLIQSPHNGRPALALQGESFMVELQEEATLQLRSEKRTIPLDVTWSVGSGGNVTGTCRVPSDAAPGPYTLEAATVTSTDQNIRSVYLYDAFPEDYRIAHVPGESVSAERLQRALATAGESGAAFALITAPLANTKDPELLEAFSTVLDESPLPAFLCPQQNSSDDDPYAALFGTRSFAFQFGRDGYLGFNAPGAPNRAALTDAPAAQHRLRRFIRPARWSIGFTQHYDAAMDMRSQLTLFVDDPLDVLIAGDVRAGHETIPWGSTALIATAGNDVQLIEVSEQGVNEIRPQ